MVPESEPPDDLLRRALAGDEAALAALFARHRERLRRMVGLRLDRRLTGRVAPSDILQDAYLEVRRRFVDYARSPDLPFFLWLRLVTGQKLIDAHRHHLGAKSRDAGLEVSLHRGAVPPTTEYALSAWLLGEETSVCRAAIRAEHRLIVREALNSMDPIDREVLVLRHFEQLSNAETATALGLKKSAASQRYVRALRRLKEALSAIPGVLEDFQ